MGAMFRKSSHGAFLAAALVSACLLAGCTSDGTSAPTASLAPGASASAADIADAGADVAGTVAYEDNALYAGRSIYRCDNGESLEVNNTVTQVALGLADGTVMELPASPADSHTRSPSSSTARKRFSSGPRLRLPHAGAENRRRPEIFNRLKLPASLFMY